MALVTVQRSPSLAGSPQCSISDGETEEDENGKYEHSPSSESFFAKGTALVLALNDIPQYSSERRYSTDSNRSTNSTISSGSDIQQHLQSMFYLLKHEETLKMAVKLESQRPNRTRYLAVVSHAKYSSTNKMKSKKHMKTNVPAKKFTEQQKDMEKEKVDEDEDENEEETIVSTKSVQKLKLAEDFGINTDSDQYECEKDNSNSSNIGGSTGSSSNSSFAQYSKITNKSNMPCDKLEKGQSASDTKKDVEESCILGIDCNEKTTIGLVLRILADTSIHLDGDGGFSISVYGKTHIFKPVSVQAMWSALQTLHKVSQKARENNFYPGGPSHDWVSYYESRIDSDRSCLNEWNAMDSLESRRPPSPDAIRNKPTEKNETEKVIRTKLKEIMMSVDLDEVTSKYIRSRLEEYLDMDLAEYKSFIDEEMLVILGQMDAPTEIFEHVYLGSEWNASNLEELQKNGVRHILNVTREIDNFFPGMFDYFNVRVYDDEKTNLLKHWDNTFKYISRAKDEGSKVLVHCKMGVSRSASVVIAYAMKAYNWDFDYALQHVKERRNCIKPNKNFLAQLETYRGMLDAMKNKEKLQRSKSETNLKNAKDARLLPGSEPTPLIQALNNSKNLENHWKIKNSKCLIRRSSSTSPKSLQNSIVVRQQSQSLENLAPDRPIEEQKNVLYPGNNGQNYSVTQNQVLHLEENNPVTSVKTIVNDLESNNDKERKVLTLQIDNTIDQNRLIHDESDTSPVWTSSAQIVHQTINLLPTSGELIKNGNNKIQRRENDIFSSQLDNIFDNDESRQIIKGGSFTSSWTTSYAPIEPIVSRQSSCSSVDSAVFLAFPGDKQDTHSRHSSWGSGDTRIPPSRNSSWGSYDTSKLKFCNSNVTITEGQVHNSIEPVNTSSVDGIFLLQSGTVKRTKQKLEECTSLKKLCGDVTPENHIYDIDVGKQNLNTFQCDKNSNEDYTNRCNSEEIMLNVDFNNTETQYNNLSISAPDTYTSTKIDGDNFLIEHNFNDNVNQEEEEHTSQNKISSNVQNLKKNFEAKASTKNIVIKKVRSLPSSPIASHIEADTHKNDNIKNTESKDFTVKCLVNKYQSSDNRQAFSNYRIRPRSFYESRTSSHHHQKQQQQQQQQHQSDIEMNSNFQKIQQSQQQNEFSRPPVPPINISNKNATTSIITAPNIPSIPLSTTNNITMTEGILPENYRRVQHHQQHHQQQKHGKSHPHARLSLSSSKQRFNTAAYNTM